MREKRGRGCNEIKMLKGQCHKRCHGNVLFRSKSMATKKFNIFIFLYL